MKTAHGGNHYRSLSSACRLLQGCLKVITVWGRLFILFLLFRAVFRNVAKVLVLNVIYQLLNHLCLSKDNQRNRNPVIFNQLGNGLIND